jgi:hypothetical protein
MMTMVGIARSVTEADDRRESGAFEYWSEDEARHDQADDEKQFDFEGHDPHPSLICHRRSGTVNERLPRIGG